MNDVNVMELLRYPKVTSAKCQDTKKVPLEAGGVVFASSNYSRRDCSPIKYTLVKI